MKANYQKLNSTKNESQFQMLKKLESVKKFQSIHAHCKKRKIGFLSSPFDIESFIFLKNLI